MTKNRGVDVVLNSLAGDGLTASWACMASFGRFVEIGKRDIHAHSRLDMFYFAKNVSFTAVDVFGMTKERPELVRESLGAAMELVAAGKAKASYPIQVYPVSQIEGALRHMQSGKSVGKLTIEMSKEENVLVCPSFFLWQVDDDTDRIANQDTLRRCSIPSLALLSTPMPHMLLLAALAVLLDALHAGWSIKAPAISCCWAGLDPSLSLRVNSLRTCMPLGSKFIIHHVT
jgi:hypothetical protein